MEYVSSFPHSVMYLCLISGSYHYFWKDDFPASKATDDDGGQDYRIQTSLFKLVNLLTLLYTTMSIFTKTSLMCFIFVNQHNFYIHIFGFVFNGMHCNHVPLFGSMIKEYQQFHFGQTQTFLTFPECICIINGLTSLSVQILLHIVRWFSSFFVFFLYIISRYDNRYSRIYTEQVRFVRV